VRAYPLQRRYRSSLLKYIIYNDLSLAADADGIDFLADA